MSSDTQTSFLLYYVRSLVERTRAEKKGDKYGFDWIIYNLALAYNWVPVRLPFLRTGSGELSATKTENEFGVDCSFLSSDKEELHIFVLKDEVLNSANWTPHAFDTDLRKAAYPNLSSTGLESVKRVFVTLAYNKDEDAAGIHLFENLVSNYSPIIARDVELKFQRWNLTELVERVKSTLLTPSLLPQKFFSLFAYVCAQFSDFQHGSDEWENNVVRTWRHFLKEVLDDKGDERSIRMLPVALMILREHGKTNPTFETGWIDLTEWAMLAAWKASEHPGKKSVRKAVFEMWTGFYIQELDRFYRKHEKELATEHFLDDLSSGSYLESVASGMVAYWHLARLGILGVAYQEFLPHDTQEQKQYRFALTNEVTNRIVGMLNKSPACLRPILDLHHIELFLVWRSLWQHQRLTDIYWWLGALQQALYVRRSGRNPLPFIEGHNRLELVWEALLTKKPYDYCDQSSLLVLMLLEFCCSLPEAEGNELLEVFYRNVVLSIDAHGQGINGNKPLDLMAWVPPDDWSIKLSAGSIAQEGESLSFLIGHDTESVDPVEIRNRLKEFVAQTRSERTFEFPIGLPVSVIVLACLKHRSPLPMELWRSSIFRKAKASTMQETK